MTSIFNENPIFYMGMYFALLFYFGFLNTVSDVFLQMSFRKHENLQINLRIRIWKKENTFIIPIFYLTYSFLPLVSNSSFELYFYCFLCPFYWHKPLERTVIDAYRYRVPFPNFSDGPTFLTLSRISRGFASVNTFFTFLLLRSRTVPIRFYLNASFR